jgi:hypothetical protein
MRVVPTSTQQLSMASRRQRRLKTVVRNKTSEAERSVRFDSIFKPAL